MNTRAIQHNLDWVWPYWVERQFDPEDVAFIPRAFSITHVNLTHRNWTAVGLPDCEDMPIVDPRGLLTPDWDGWSLDGWIISDDGAELMPSRMKEAEQRLELNDNLSVVTRASDRGLAISSSIRVEPAGSNQRETTCLATYEAHAKQGGWLAVGLRPYNPEGVSFINEIGFSRDRHAWTIDGKERVIFDAAPDRHHSSDYRHGDVHLHLRSPSSDDRTSCHVGLATAAAMFRLKSGESRRVSARVVLQENGTKKTTVPSTWPDALAGCCQLQVPDEHIQFLYQAALGTLVLHSPGEVYPGPYTYKRFWFRDAAFMIHALLSAGLYERAERAVDGFPERQTVGGYFKSQEGEWDSNGEALWIMHRFCELTGRSAKPDWIDSIRAGGNWIVNKLQRDNPASPHAGLLPAGFSAEHLGPNDYYYWDDFWGVAGLRCAANLLYAAGFHAPTPRSAAAVGFTASILPRLRGRSLFRRNEANANALAEDAAQFRRSADRLLAAIDRSLSMGAERRSRLGMPASPYRRMDSGSIGSIVAGYPLQLWPANDPRLLDTVEFLLSRCFINGAFFQDMIHSGLNPYLTLHVAQVLLRAEDSRFFDLVQTVARLASPTGQWPEAIHPRTLGGCMGDGQHAWAAAEWLLMLRNMFVREEGERLVVGAGIPEAWLDRGKTITCGPTATPFGPMSLTIEPSLDHVRVSWEWEERDRNAEASATPVLGWKTEPVVEVRIAGAQRATVEPGRRSVEVQRRRGHADLNDD